MLSILIPTLTPISTFIPTTTSFDSPRNLSEEEHINQEEKREWFGKTSGVKGLCYMVQSHNIGYWLGVPKAHWSRHLRSVSSDMQKIPI